MSDPARDGRAVMNDSDRDRARRPRPRPLRAAARGDPGAAALAFAGDPADRARADPGRLDRGDGRADQHDQPGRQGRLQPALADPAVVRHQGLRPGRARAVTRSRTARRRWRRSTRCPGPRLGVSWLCWLWLIMMLTTQAQIAAMEGTVGQAAHMAFPGASQAIADAAGTLVASWGPYPGEPPGAFLGGASPRWRRSCCCSPAATAGSRRSRPSWSPR